MKETTLVIRGYLREETYRFYCKFYKDVPKIFSVWDDNSQLMGWKGEMTLHSGVDIVVPLGMPEMAVAGGYGIYAEMGLTDTIRALDAVDTRYVIRLKGNEWYSNLSSVERAIKSDEDKIHMIPAFLKKWSTWPFHMSDNIIAGKTENIRMMFERCSQNMMCGRELNANCWPLPFQSILAQGYLEVKLGRTPSKEDFKDAFRLLDLDSLRYYKVSSATKSWYSDFKPNVSSMDDI